MSFWWNGDQEKERNRGAEKEMLEKTSPEPGDVCRPKASASSQCYLDELMLLKCVLMLLKCELMLFKFWANGSKVWANAFKMSD